MVNCSLYLNSLSGTLPSSWGANMTQMSRFYVYENSLIGSLPESYGMWSQLIEMDVSGNQLNGTLPSSWSSLTALRKLHVFHNRLSGTLPESWVNMSGLRELAVNNNALTGSLPSAWGGVDGGGGGGATIVLNLTSFYGDVNQLTGSLPDSWSNSMRHLRVFSAAYNALSGALPASWSAMTELVTFSAFANSLSGQIPEAWSAMSTSLQEFLVNNNQLTGSLPESWSALSSLTQFLVQNNRLTGSIPPSWGNTMLRTRRFYAQQNSLSGELPSTFQSMVNLVEFAVNNNQLTGTLPDGYSTWTRVQTLFVASNLLSGSLPSSWSAMISLLQVDFSNCQLLTGTLPVSWASWTSISELYLGGNQITGSFPPQWSSMTNLTIFVANGNKLAGQLPDAWSKWKKMSQFFVHENSLTGTLPTSWSAWGSNVLYLYVSQNPIVGSLPSSWSSMTQVIQFMASSMSVSGTLPSSWGAMTQLQYLYLHNNSLTGTLPASWQELSSVVLVFLQHNTFSGSLPASWSRLPPFVGLNLSWNCFHSSLPSPWTTSLRQVDLCRSGVTLTTATTGGEGWPAFMSCATSVSSKQQCATKTLQLTATKEHLRSVTASLRVAERNVFDPPAVSAVVVADVSGAASAVAAVLVTSSALGVRRLGVIASIGACSDDERATVASVLGEASAAPLDSPLQLQIGSDNLRGATQRGTVVGNIILLAGVSILSVIVTVAYGRWLATARPLTLRKAAGALRLPGALMGLVALLLQPTVVASTQLVGYGDGSGDMGIGCVGLITATVLFVRLAAVLDPRGGIHFLAIAEVVPNPQQLRRQQRQYISLCTQRWHALSDPSCVWHPSVRAASTDRDTIHQYLLLFESCRGGRHWWLLVDTATTLIIGALGGLIPESESSCRGIAWSVCGVCFLVLLAYLVSRPANNTIEAFAGLILLSAQVAVAVCSAVGSSGAADAANIIALAATVFSCIQTLASFVVFKLFQRQDELLALLLSRWKRNINKHSSDEEGNQQQKSIHLNVPSPPTMKNIGIHKLVAANKEERRQVLHHEALISFVTMIWIRTCYHQGKVNNTYKQTRVQIVLFKPSVQPRLLW